MTWEFFTGRLAWHPFDSRLMLVWVDQEKVVWVSHDLPGVPGSVLDKSNLIFVKRYYHTMCAEEWSE